MVHRQVKRRNTRTVVCVVIMVVVCSARHDQRIPTVLRLPCVTLTHSLARLVIGTMVHCQMQSISPLTRTSIGIQIPICSTSGISKACTIRPRVAVAFCNIIYLMRVRTYRDRLTFRSRTLSSVGHSNTILRSLVRRNRNLRSCSACVPQICVRPLLHHKVMDFSNGTLSSCVFLQGSKLPSGISIKNALLRTGTYSLHMPRHTTISFSTRPVWSLQIQRREEIGWNPHPLQYWQHAI